MISNLYKVTETRAKIYWIFGNHALHKSVIESAYKIHRLFENPKCAKKVKTNVYLNFLPPNKAVTGLVSLYPGNFLRKHTRVGTYICIYLFSEMSYAIGSSAYFFFFFHIMHLKVLPYLYTNLFFFFFNNGIIFHPKEASCFIYPSATAGHLGLPPILELHTEHQSPLRFAVSGHTLPLSRT